MNTVKYVISWKIYNKITISILNQYAWQLFQSKQSRFFWYSLINLDENSIILVGFPLLGVIIIDIIMIVVVIVLEEFTIKHNTITYSIIYEDLDLLKTGKKQKILKEISILTGKEILRFKIREIDYKDNIAKLDITYRE